MKKFSKRMKGICVASTVIVASLVGGVLTATSQISNVYAVGTTYVELYSPTSDTRIATSNAAHLNPSVVDDARTESGKALALDYKVGHTSSVTVTIPVTSQDATNFKGLAMWVDVPETADAYSFTMYIAKSSSVWQTMELASSLTLIDEDGTVSSKTSLWKRQQLNGFTGWVMIPEAAYADPIPESSKPYQVIIMMENEPAENAARTEDMVMSIGSFGYYTDYTSFLYEKAGVNNAAKQTLKEIDGYIADIDKLTPKSEKQIKLRNEMLVYFSNIKENFNSLSETDKVDIAKELYDNYYTYMEKYLYGDIRQTQHIMSFAIMSDTHFTQTWVNERFVNALADAKELDPNLAGAFVLGDISDNGVDADDVKNGTDVYTELDNYYDWLDAYQPTYKNASGEQIPIINVMGNHDVRGHNKLGYPATSYQPAVDMYLQRESLANEANSIQFDTWINGYHFVFLNTDKYHSDDCYLSGETLTWLDETLSENEDGRPMFVMVHQPLGKVHTMEGASMTFEEVIARHPSAIVSSGHEHAAFGAAKIVQEGNGVFVNQPAMVNVDAQYYFVEVYEGGVIYRAREAATSSWRISSDVVVANEDRSNNVVFSADSFDVNSLETTNVTASIVKADSVSGKALKLIGNGTLENVEIPAYAMGNVENYGGYALYMEADSSVALKFANKALKAGATYYTISNGAYVEKTVGANGEIVADGWVVIPKAAIDGIANPTKDSVLSIAMSNETIYVDQISYWFDAEALLAATMQLSYVFYNDDGSVISSGVSAFGETVKVPTNPEKAMTEEAIYSFVGWDLDGDGVEDELPTSLKGNISAKAVYKTTIRQYTYVFYDSDGETELITGTVAYGTKIEAPTVEGLFGWDIDNDGATESLPETLTSDLTAVAILGEPPYENAEVLFDPSALSSIGISTGSWYGVASGISVSTLPITNEKSPTGKAVQFTHPGSQAAGGTWTVTLNIPASKTYADFQGYAIWVDISATTEEYTGALCVNGIVPWGTNAWTLINENGTQTTADATAEKGNGLALGLGKGFTGWIVFDKTILASDQSATAMDPSANGNFQFRFVAEKRTVPFTMNIGQVLVFSDKAKLVSELTDTSTGTLTYSFSDGNGYVYKAGQVTTEETIVVPNDPVAPSTDYFFAGWDTNMDNKPDTIPANGKITEDLKAVALFYHVNAFKSFDNGTKSVWTLSGKNATLKQETYADSATGTAMHFVVDPSKGDTAEAQYAFLSIPSNEQVVGVAFWMDASNNQSFEMRVWKNWIPKGTVVEGGDYIYFYGDDGSITQFAGWRDGVVPANFKGWVIVPMKAFIKEPTNYPGDQLRLGFLTNIARDIYFGESVTFNCPVESFMKQIDKQVYGFKDYDDSYISCGLLDEGDTFAAPTNPTRDGWEFIGWDINGDGVADTIPTTIGRNFSAKALYSREFTYKFVDEEGEIILEKTADYNSLILPPFRYLEDTEQYDYEVDYGGYEYGMLLTEDVTFVVTYEVTIIKYTYSFINGNNTVVSNTIEYGTEIVAPTEVPTKEGDAQYSYTFAGWKGYTEGMTISQDVTFEAEFTATLNAYEVVFYDEDGETVISTETLAYGSKITLPQAPKKEGFVFVRWEGYTKNMTVSQDVSFTAVYIEDTIVGGDDVLPPDDGGDDVLPPDNNQGGTDNGMGCDGCVASTNDGVLGAMLLALCVVGVSLIARGKKKQD